MKFLRNLFDDAKPSFSKGGTAEKYFPIYDIFENLFFLSRNKTKNPIHIRDSTRYSTNDGHSLAIHISSNVFWYVQHWKPVS